MRGGKVEYEDIALEQIQRLPPRAVECERPGEAVAHVGVARDCLQICQRAAGIHHGLPLPVTGSSLSNVRAAAGRRVS